MKKLTLFILGVAFSHSLAFSQEYLCSEKLIEKQITRAEASVSISTLPRGIYFVRLQNEKMVEVVKMIKE